MPARKPANAYASPPQESGSPTPKTRYRLNDRQCRIFLRVLRDFGYTAATFDEVRKIADAVAEGTHSTSDVYAILLCKQIDEAFECARKGKRPEWY